VNTIGKIGWVYIVKDQGRNIKIGESANYRQRIRELKSPYGSKLELVARAWSVNCQAVEKQLHNKYAHRRFRNGISSGSTEWFKLSYFEVFCAVWSLRWYSLRLNLHHLGVPLIGMIAILTTVVIAFLQE
jgi:T5orf172 domain